MLTSSKKWDYQLSQELTQQKLIDPYMTLLE